MLSEKDLKELTNFNAGAFDLLRTRANEKQEKIPFWLCMSDEAKAAARQEFFKWCKEHMDNSFACFEYIENRINEMPISYVVNNWIKMETLAERDRENGGISGYFV